MLKKWTAACLSCLLCFSALEAGVLDNWSGYMWKKNQPKPEMIKVLIAQNKPGVILEVKGKYKLYDPNNMEHISTRFVGKRKFLQPLANGIKWGEEFPGIYQLLIVPDEVNSTTLIDGVEYSGNIYVYDVSGQISIVNELPVEDYLDSLLSVKYDAPYPEEYLGAMAIATRTQAYWQIQNPKTKYWAVDGAKVGYEGWTVAQRPNGVDKALATTKNMVLTENGQYFDSSWDIAKVKPLDAERLAKQGETARGILLKAFPDATLQVLQQ